MSRFVCKISSLGLICVLSGLHQNVFAAPPLRIVGSSSVFPFAASVAEHFHYKTHNPTPIVEAIGTGAGVKLFCGNPDGPDIAMTSRSLTGAEKEKCQKNGIKVEEFKIGQDGLVFIQSKQDKPFPLTLAELNQALAGQIPQGNGCKPNPYKTWKDINGDFPFYPIRVLGPAPTSGTYEVLVEKVLKECAPHLRRDGIYIEAPANENLIVLKVLQTPHTIGIVTFSFYDQNNHRLNALPINGILPSLESIQDGTYTLSRPLFVYLKTNDLASHPERITYISEFLSQEAKGYLGDKGLISLSSDEQEEMIHRAHNLQQNEELQ